MFHALEAESGLFYRAGDAFRKLLLQDEEDDDRGQRAEQNAHHQHTVVDGIAVGEVGDQDGHGLRVALVEHDAGPEVGVPRVHKGDDRRGKMICLN